ncbi:MAG: hypothetical protein M9916_11285 [Crocinitomicaceae bacterium]|nr:hypothetical protein [Crocinitomicaceae bacterium]
MKHFFIFFLPLLCANVFSQKDYYEYVELTLYNSQGEKIENATVLVDGKTVPYDSSKHSYYLIDSISKNFKVEASCEGYESISYLRENLTGSGSSFFRCFFYLKRPSEKFYYVNNWLKIPYQSQPNQLLVILNTKGFPIDDSLRLQFEREIQQKVLKISPNFPEPPSDLAEEWIFKSIPELEYRIVVEKEDGSDFESDYCEELAFLRSLDEVVGAGPLIIHSNINKYHTITYDHKIRLYQFGVHYNTKFLKERSEEINQLVKKVDKRFYFDEKTRVIVLSPDVNEILPEIMDNLREIGITENMITMLFEMSYND